MGSSKMHSGFRTTEFYRKAKCLISGLCETSKGNTANFSFFRFVLNNFKNLKCRVTERERGSKRESCIYLFSFQKATKLGAGPVEPGNLDLHLDFPCECRGLSTWAIYCYFSRSWIGGRAAGTLTDTHIGYWYYRQQLNWLHHHDSPDQLF